MYKKILYPIKFEEFSLDVLSCVLNFKKAGTEEIVLLHVIDVSKLPMDKYEGYSPEDIKRLMGIADEKMAEAVSMIEGAGIHGKKRIEVGLPYREILKAAGDEKVSLIVSGRQKRGVLGEIFIGSNTDKIIRYGTVPVYVPKYPAMYGADKEACEKFCKRLSKLLYPVDWSECADIALKYAKRLKDAGVDEIVVAHVMDETAMELLPVEKFEEYKHADKDKLKKIGEELEKEGFKVKTHLHVGKPGADLIKIAKEEDISLIVMGTHGKGRIQGILWGSVSRDVVEYSEKPVLLVRDAGCIGKGGK